MKHKIEQLADMITFLLKQVTQLQERILFLENRHTNEMNILAKEVLPNYKQVLEKHRDGIETVNQDVRAVAIMVYRIAESTVDPDLLSDLQKILARRRAGKDPAVDDDKVEDPPVLN